jgi:hypothetical protein
MEELRERLMSKAIDYHNVNDDKRDAVLECLAELDAHNSNECISMGELISELLNKTNGR